MPTKTPAPGDPGFDWTKYDEWHRANDPVASADAALSGAQSLEDSYGDLLKPDAAAAAKQYPGYQPSRLADKVRSKYPGHYDDLSNADLERAVLNKHPEYADLADIHTAAPPAMDEPSHGYHPDLADSEHPWLAAAKGFGSGVAEAATPAKLGLLATLASGGIGAIPAALTAAGASAAAEAGRVHFNTENAAQSFPEAATGVLEAGSAPLVAEALGKVPGLVSKLPKKVSGPGGAVLGGVEGYRRGGVTGALEGAAIGGTIGTGAPKGLQMIQKLLGLLGPEAGAAEEAGGFSGYAPRSAAKTVNFSGPEADDLINRATANYDTEGRWPARETAFEPAPPSDVERYAPNESGYNPARYKWHVSPAHEAAANGFGEPAMPFESTSAFNDLPLHEQMNRLPAEDMAPASGSSRFSDPPYQAPPPEPVEEPPAATPAAPAPGQTLTINGQRVSAREAAKLPEAFKKLLGLGESTPAPAAAVEDTPANLGQRPMSPEASAAAGRPLIGYSSLGEPIYDLPNIAQSHLLQPEKGTLDLANELLQKSAPGGKVTSLKAYPKPSGTDVTSKSLRQRAHIAAKGFTMPAFLLSLLGLSQHKGNE